MRLHPDVSVFAGVQLAQFFVGRRLDEPEAGNDAPAQGAGHEDTQRREEPAGENRDDSDQPDERQGEIEDGVVDTDDEVFHGAYSLRDVEKLSSPGGADACYDIAFMVQGRGDSLSEQSLYAFRSLTSVWSSINLIF